MRAGDVDAGAKKVAAVMMLIEEIIKDAPQPPTVESFQVRDLQQESVLRDLMRMLTGAVPKELGVTILLYEYGNKGNMFYASTANRLETIDLMQEFIQKNQEQK